MNPRVVPALTQRRPQHPAIGRPKKTGLSATILTATVIEEWGAAGNRGEFAPTSSEQYSGGAPPDHTSELLMIGGFPEVPGAVRTVMVQPAGGGEPVEATVHSES